VPTIWLDRTVGESKFQLREWIPKYLRWYAFAFGPPMSVDEVRRTSRKISRLNTPDQEDEDE
jgi:dolichol-phosphate mannosyltransferase